MRARAEPLIAIHEDSNSGAALFVDGELDFAAAEERFTRIRFHAGPPRNTLAAIERRIGKDGVALRRYAVANRFSFLPSLPGELLPQDEHDFFGLAHKAYLSFQQALHGSRMLRRSTEAMTRGLVSRRYQRTESLIDHHTAHAYSAYLTSGFAEATAVTADGFGDASSGKVFTCRAGRCTELYGGSPAESAGIYHAELAQLLGIDPRLGGKVTGMAAYGDPRAARPLVDRLLSLRPDRRSFVAPPIWRRSPSRSPYAELKAMPMRDVAAAIQQRLEELLLAYVARAIEDTGLPDVVLAGGVFGNVKVVQGVWSIPGVRRVFVHPAMNDQGIAVGAGLAYLASTRNPSPTRLANIFLGPEFSDEECAAALDRAGIRYTEEEDIDARVAGLLASGEIVARFAGRMEYGPRALGNRSILYRSDDPSVNDWLNKMLRRREYMPFAPVTLMERASDCYGDLSRCEECVRFMTISVPCTDAMKRASPGAVHVDGTARPQVLWEADNPAYYRILKLYYEATGNPTLINTSFNMHEEPIVCSPDDACRAFLASGLPYLAIHRFLAIGNGRPSR